MPIPALIVLRIPEPLSRFTFKNCLIHTPNVYIHGWTLPVSIGQKPGRDRVQLDAAIGQCDQATEPLPLRQSLPAGDLELIARAMLLYASNHFGVKH